MKNLSRIAFWILLAACLSPQGRTLMSQRAQSVAIQTTTQERLETEPWWPTLSNVPLSSFAGSEACVRCHQDVSQDGGSAMEHAAAVAKRATFLSGKSPLAF